MISSRNYFKRQVLLLFFIVSLTPALTVSALWYYFTKDSGIVTVEIGRYLAPLALLGLAPAIALSAAFAELLVRPIRRIHDAINQIAAGNLTYRINFKTRGEFAEIAQGLDQIAADLEQIISQSRGETELINAERNKLKTVLDGMSDGVVALDSGRAIILYNKGASELTGQALSEVGGRVFEHVLPLTKNGVQVVSEWLIHEDTRLSIGEWTGLELARPDGELRFVDVRAIRLRDDPNGIKILMTLHDQTSAMELETMKIDFVALAAHELRTPLTSIKGYLDVLQFELGSKLDRVHKSFLQRSIHGSNQLLGLVNNLLNVSRIEHGEISYAFDTVDWHDFITDAAKDLQASVINEDRKFAIKVPKHLGTVSIDGFAITEVLTNWINNAVKHTRAGDTIEIVTELAKGDREIQTTVRDTGSGIPKEALPKLFGKFYRVEGLRSGGGTGLGLYISKSIIEAHHGYVWVESELGKGTTFGFNLPIVASDTKTSDNDKHKLIHGAHGWIKNVPAEERLAKQSVKLPAKPKAKPKAKSPKRKPKS